MFVLINLRFLFQVIISGSEVSFLGEGFRGSGSSMEASKLKYIYIYIHIYIYSHGAPFQERVFKRSVGLFSEPAWPGL